MISYTEEEKVVVTKLVMELARIDNKKRRKDLVGGIPWPVESIKMKKLRKSWRI